MPTLPKALGSANDFYAYLGVGAGERKFLEKHAFHRYKRVIVPKRRGGTRVLMVPDRRLKFLQRKAHQLLNQLYRPRTPVHGFVKQKGAISNANEHQRRPYLFNIDLRNFFGVISRRRVLGMLISMGFRTMRRRRFARSVSQQINFPKARRHLRFFLIWSLTASIAI